MERGKKKCETLMAIRKEVANANGIDYEPTKCDYEGDCKGTCPKCDAELAELQRELDAKEQKGESVAYECSLSGIQLEQDGESLDEKTQKSIPDHDGGIAGPEEESLTELERKFKLAGKPAPHLLEGEPTIGSGRDIPTESGLPQDNASTKRKKSLQDVTHHLSHFLTGVFVEDEDED